MAVQDGYAHELVCGGASLRPDAHLGTSSLSIPKESERCRVAALTVPGSLIVNIGNGEAPLDVVLRDLWVGESLSFNGSRPVSLRLENIQCIWLRGYLKKINQLEFAGDVQCERIELESAVIGSFLVGGRTRVGNLALSFDSADRIEIGGDFKAHQASLYVGQAAEQIHVAGWQEGGLVVKGESVETSSLGGLQIALAGPTRDGRGPAPRINLSDFSVGDLIVNGGNGEEGGSVSGTIGLELWLHNIAAVNNVEVDLGSLPIGEFQVRRMRAAQPFGARIAVRSTGVCSNCSVVLADIINLSPEVEWGDRIHQLQLRGIEAGHLSIELGQEWRQLPEDIAIGSLDLENGLEGSEDLLLGLAQANRPEQPFERSRLFRLIEEQGFERTEDGYQRPGLNARRALKLAELAERPPYEKFFGLLLYGITGFGIDLWPPLIVGISIWSVLSFGAYWSLRNELEVGKWIALPMTFAATALSAVTLGVMAGTVAEWVEDKLGCNRRLKAFRALVLFVGACALVQLSLAAIFFSQTTLAWGS